MAAIKTEIQGPWTRCLKGGPWKTLRGFPHYNYPLNTAASGWRPVPVSEVERGDARQDAPSCRAPSAPGREYPERSGGPNCWVCFLLLAFLCTRRRSPSKGK